MFIISEMRFAFGLKGLQFGKSVPGMDVFDLKINAIFRPKLDNKY